MLRWLQRGRALINHHSPSRYEWFKTQRRAHDGTPNALSPQEGENDLTLICSSRNERKRVMHGILPRRREKVRLTMSNTFETESSKDTENSRYGDQGQLCHISDQQ